jgi:hypothetical protein
MFSRVRTSSAVRCYPKAHFRALQNCDQAFCNLPLAKRRQKQQVIKSRWQKAICMFLIFQLT